MQPPQPAQQQQHVQRVVEATRAVIRDSPTLGMKAVFAAVRELMDPSDPPTAKEVRRALAQVKPKAPKPSPRPRPAAPRPAAAAAEEEGGARADYTGLRIDPAALSAGGAAAQLELLRRARGFIAAHRALLERQAFDIYFVVDGMWEALLPPEWRPLLDGASPAQLAGLCVGRVPQDWPESLHEFVRAAQAAQLDPTPRAAAAAGEGSDGAAAWRRHWRGTSPKKREEMERMAAAVVEAARTAGTANVVDVGAGKGYLSSLLAMEHGLKVLAVEGNGKFTAAAERRLGRIARRRQPTDEAADDGAFLGVEGEATPIFVTAMVSAARPGPADPAAKELAAVKDSAPQPDAAAAERSAGAAEAAEGEARAAQLAKEQRSREMRQQFATGAAAAAIAASEAQDQRIKRPRDDDATLAAPNGDTDEADSGEADSAGGGGGAGEQRVESLLDGAGLSGGAVLVGLHACGDLTADSCRLFLSTPRLTGLVLCGCCYGRLTEPASFPLSKIGAEVGLELGYTLRDLATHRVYGIAAQPEAWAERVLYTASYRESAWCLWSRGRMKLTARLGCMRRRDAGGIHPTLPHLRRQAAAASHPALHRQEERRDAALLCDVGGGGA